ncbi:MAG: hypothetical protein LBL66_01250 [Clostridiales bacterium]|nr:hypothetical protein [Clostridiales bacterium]
MHSPLLTAVHSAGQFTVHSPQSTVSVGGLCAGVPVFGRDCFVALRAPRNDTRDVRAPRYDKSSPQCAMSSIRYFVLPPSYFLLFLLPPSYFLSCFPLRPCCLASALTALFQA